VSLDQPASASGTLRLALAGGIDLDELAAPDHSVEVWLNGVEVGSRRFDGITALTLELPVTNLVNGANAIRVVLPLDTGFDVDQISIQDLSIEYAIVASKNAAVLIADGLADARSLDERLFADGAGDDLAALDMPARGQFQIAGRSASDTLWVASNGALRELAVSANAGIAADRVGGATVIVANRANLPTPEIAAAPALAPLPAGRLEYVAISHPLFAQAIGPLLTARQTEGLQVASVDVTQLYRRYTAGNAIPGAIEAFVRDAAPRGLRYVTLVGSANYNSVDRMGASVSAISHIPTAYVRVNQLVTFAPADSRYGDLTGDFVPEVMVGRLPVRTVAEADEAVRKLIAYQSQPATNRFIATSGGIDNELGMNFRSSVDRMAGALAPGWATTRIDVDALGAAGARNALIAGLNQGASVVSYTGHSGPTMWGFEPMLSASDAAGFPQSPNQPALLQFGCWTTYFLSPVSLTMGNAWMLTPGRGASSGFGATVLMNQQSHDQMAAVLMPKLIPGVRLGDAIMLAQRQLAPTLPLNDEASMLIGLTLLGDPAQRIR